MVGLIAPQTPSLGAHAMTPELDRADRTFAAVARDFFHSRGVEVEVSFQDRFVRASLPQDMRDPHLLAYNLTNLQEILNAKAPLVNLKEGGRAVARLGFPFPGLLVGLLTFLYGAQVPELIFVSRDISRDEINEMYKKNRQPVGVFSEPVYLSHYGAAVHPFIFMFHDLYHAVFVAALPLDVRRHWCALYDMVNALPSEARSLPVAESLLNGFTNTDIDGRAVASKEVLTFVPFQPVIDRICGAYGMENGEEALAVFGECETLLGVLLKTLNTADDPALLYKDFLIGQLGDLQQGVTTQAAIRKTLESFA